MKLQKALRGALFAAFFVLVSYLLRLFSLVYGDSYQCNASGAWSIPVAPGVLVFLGTFFLSAIFWQWTRSKETSEELGWLALFAGGLSNLGERVLFGCIGDYFSLPLFPVFNLSDVLITVGTIFVFFSFYRRILVKQKK